MQFWAIVTFTLAMFAIYAPNVLEIYGIHNNYEMITHRRVQLLFPDFEHLFSIARPVAALFTNLTVLPVETLGDIRWMRLFSIVTSCVLCWQVLAICRRWLGTTTWEGIAVAVGTFAAPAFTYSVLDPSAWVSHLLTIMLALGGYQVLARSNAHALPVVALVEARDFRAVWLQCGYYLRQPSIWWASALLQVALYDYPPYALVILIFPVVAVLLSPTPWSYRYLIAVRDLAFIGGNMVLFSVSAKLLYLPFVRLFTSRNVEPLDPTSNPFAEHVGKTYSFSFNADLAAIYSRLGKLFSVSGDLWFLPQSRFHLILIAVAALALLLANLLFVFRRGESAQFEGGRWQRDESATGRLTFRTWYTSPVIPTAVVVMCFLMATSPVWAAIGGIITYRTVAVPTALAAAVFIFFAKAIAEGVSVAIGLSRRHVERVTTAALVLTVGAATLAGWYTNYLTMRLARNEFRYFTAMVKEAAEKKATTIILIDPRPLSLAEAHPKMTDGRGRAIPPYELGCFSGYCLQDGSIIKIANAELARPIKDLQVFVQRENHPVPGLSCSLLAGPSTLFPPGISQLNRRIIQYYRTINYACVDYNLSWRDLGDDWPF